MCTLQAAEEGQKAARAAPSKAAEKRAHMKAAARAATAAPAAAVPPPAAASSQRAEPSNTLAASVPDAGMASAASDAAARLQCVGLADGTASQADPFASSTTGQHRGCMATTAAADQQRQRSEPGPPPAPPPVQQQRQPQWMLCPITKVRGACASSYDVQRVVSAIELHFAMEQAVQLIAESVRHSVH